MNGRACEWSYPWGSAKPEDARKWTLYMDQSSDANKAAKLVLHSFICRVLPLARIGSGDVQKDEVLLFSP